MSAAHSLTIEYLSDKSRQQERIITAIAIAKSMTYTRTIGSVSQKQSVENVLTDS